MVAVVALDQAMGIAGPWRPAWRVLAPLVIAKDQRGNLQHCYRGALLGWLGDEQAAHYLRHGLVERVDDDAEVMPSDDAVAKCVSALVACSVPVTAGAPTARDALRNSGRKFSNAAIAQAVKVRQASAPMCDEDFDEVIVE